MNRSFILSIFGAAFFCACNSSEKATEKPKASRTETSDTMNPPAASNKSRVAADLYTLNQAIDFFKYQNNGKLPETLNFLAEKDSNGIFYLKNGRLLRDPWGHEYAYIPSANGMAFELICYGSDGRPGGEGDAKDISLETLQEERPVTAKAPAIPTLKEFPREVLRELNSRVDKYSSQVDSLEHREMDADKLSDPAKRLAEYDALRDRYGECREGISEVLDDPKYAQYKDPAYGPFWAGFENRMRYWNAKMKSIKKKRDRTVQEVEANKDKKDK